MELRAEHLVSLSRSHCSGCPDHWKEQPCEFLDVLKRDGSGTEASLCRNVDATRPARKLPPDIVDLARARISEAGDRAARSTDEALRLYAFGNDLHRLGRSDLWLLGDEVHISALDLLSEAKPDATWPGQLVRLVEGGAPPVRITDVVLGDAISATRVLEPDRQAAIRRASELATDAIRSPDEKRLGVLLGFADAYAWDIDVVDAWAAGEQNKDRAIRLGLTAALAALGERECPASLDVLVPDRIAHIPNGWVLEPTSCQPRPPREPPARSHTAPAPAEPAAAVPASAESASGEPAPASAAGG